MILSGQTALIDLLGRYPQLEDFLVRYNSRFWALKNHSMRASVGRIASLYNVAQVTGLNLEELLQAIAVYIERETGERIAVQVS